MSGRRRIVVTGVGLVSSIGDSPTDLHGALTARCRESTIVAFDPAKYFGTRNTRPLDHLGQLVSAAAGLTLADACCSPQFRAEHAVALVLGTMFAGVRTICAFDRQALEIGPEYASPMDFANTVLNAAAGQAAIWHGLRGPNATIAAGVASGLQAIAYAADLIAAGTVDCALAGGADERSPDVADGLERAGLLPSGIAFGEAAAFVMLEAEDIARMRAATIRAEIRGSAAGRASTRHEGVDPNLKAGVIRAALSDANISEREVDLVSACGWPETEGDTGDATPLARVLNDRRLTTVASVESAVGHTLGASGALQVIEMLEVMRARTDLRIALIQSVGWDGHCCAVVIGSRTSAA